MPATGAPSGMGGMQPPGSGESTPDIAQMMGGASSNSGTGGSSSAATPSAQQLQQMQQMMGQNGQNPGAEAMGGVATAAGNGQKPRAVGTVVQEAQRFGGDVLKSLKDFFSVQTWLGIEPSKLDPQQQAKARQVHQRYQQLDQEQQQVAQQMFEEKMQRKRIQEEEAMRKRQRDEEQKAQSVVMPSSPQKGAQAQGGSKKQRATQKLQNDRKTLSTSLGE